MFRAEFAPVPIGESSTEVLDHMVDFNDIPIRDKIMNEVRENDIRLIMPFGSPRSGKTTLSTQLARAISEDPRTPKVARLVFFDDALREAESVFGLDPISDWEEEWTIASDFYYRRIESLLDSLTPETVLIAENVGVGKTDRGISTLRNLARTHIVDTFYLGIVRDPKVGSKATQIRKALLTEANGSFSVPDHEVLRFLESHNLFVTGADDLTPAEAGRKIRQIVSRMDPFYDTPALANTEEEEKEMIERTQTYNTNGFPKGANRLPELSEMIYQVQHQTKLRSGRIGPPLPKSIENSGHDPAQKSTMQLQADYFQDLRTELGIRKSRFYVVFNSYLEDVPIHYLDLNLYR